MLRLNEETVALPDIAFDKIRPHEGSRNGGFEELCAQLAALEPASASTSFFRKGRGGDAGVECFERRSDGTERGWQAKYLFSWDQSLSSQLSKSIRVALDKHPKLTDYVVCLPFDLPDVRPDKGQSAAQKWEAWKAKWEKTASEEGRALSISLWDKSGFSRRLAAEDPAYAGRLLYWFGTESLTTSWFEQQFGKAKAGLGSRYTPDTNVELPIRKSFLGFARDPSLQKAIDDWFVGLRSSGQGAVDAVKNAVPAGQDDPHSEPLERALDALAEQIGLPPIGPESPYPLHDWFAATKACLAAARAALSWTFGLPSEKTANSSVDPKQWAQHSLHEILGLLSIIADALDSEEWRLANEKTALLEGAAGIGKSHLLADVVEHQINAGRPAILVLGSSLIDAEPWRQILLELDLPPTLQAKHFLGSLDAAAEASGVRAIICIDALNERHGLDIWPSRLAAFLKTVDPFPRVSVALSCRSTYVTHVIPEELEGTLARIEHLGFAGDGGAAAKLYLRKRGIVRPGTPNLVPEFDNPLFLKTCCDLLEKEGKRDLPKGLRGVTAIFNFYNEAVSKALTRRMKLDPALTIVERAIQGFAKLLLDSRQNYVAKPKAIALFETLLVSGGSLDRSLLSQLESEGLLSIEIVRQDDDTLEPMVRFTFERLSDHAVASRVLDECLVGRSVPEAFATGSKLHEIVFGPESYRYSGIVEAIAVQLPERTSHEILDVGDTTWSTREAFIESLLWRDQAYFSDRTFELLRTQASDRAQEIMISIATEPENKFNARHLDKVLRRVAMPERDERWSIWVAENDHEDGAVDTLITWAFENGMEAIDDDRAELAATTLCWLFSTTNRPIRDRATKSLTALFANRLERASSTIRAFQDVDDPYVVERLFAAAYGAALQGIARSGLRDLAWTTYEVIFASGTPPMNALIRDNAYGIIKYAQMRGELPSEADAERFEPPYASPWPIEHVPDEVIDAYTMDYGKGERFSDPIVSSAVHDGDFARYVIDARLDDWSPAPIGSSDYPTYREVCLAWVDEFNASATLPQLEAFDAVLQAAEAMKGVRTPRRDQDKDAVGLANEAFRATLSSDAWEEYRVRAKHYIAYTLFSDWVHDQAAKFNTAWARRWVCKRAHDLGWTAERFMKFDRSLGYDRHDHRVERIGKKYQWLAVYELAARMSDNLAFLGGYGDYEESEHRGYGMAREVRLREIDPSLLVQKTHYDGWAQWDKTWWVPVEVKMRPVEPAERLAWLNGDQDVLNDASLIEVTEPKTKRSWLCLNTFANWRQRGLFNDREEMQRDTWFRLNCIVVKKTDEAKLVQSLKRTMLTDPHRLPRIELHGDHHLGEYPWHPTVSTFGDWMKPDQWNGLKVPTRATVADYMCERGGYDYSISETVHVTLPAPWLAKALDVRLSDGRALNYVSAYGRVIFHDPSVSAKGPQAALVDREAFLAMLEREGLSAVWVIAGEKSAYGGRNAGSGFGGRVLHTGVYSLKDGVFFRHMHWEREDPSAEQLVTFFEGKPIPAGIRTRGLPSKKSGLSRRAGKEP